MNFLQNNTWLFLLLALFGAFLGCAAYGLQDPGRDDFVGVFLFYAQLYLDHGTLYAETWNYYEAFQPTKAVYKFPPVYGATLVNLLRLDLSIAVITYGMALVQLMVFLGSIYWCASALARKGDQAALYMLLATGLLFSPFVLDVVRCLQPEPFMLLFMTGAVYCLAREKDFWAGFMVGMAAITKIYPGLALLYFVVSRRWRAVGGFFVAVTAVTVYTLASIGWVEHARYLYFVLPVLFTEFPVPNNGINLAPVVFPVYYPDISGETAKHLQHVITILFVGVSLAAARMQTGDVLMKFSLFVIASLLVLANSWWYYQILLLIPILVLAAYFMEHAREQRALFGVFLMACLILLITVLSGFLNGEYGLFSWSKLSRFVYVVMRGSVPIALYAVILVILLKSRKVVNL